jgi:hypothetical protein
MIDLFERLTRAQRSGLLSLSRQWVAREGRSHAHWRKLYELGLVEARITENMRPDAVQPQRRKGVEQRLTKFGLAVATQAREGEGESTSRTTSTAAARQINRQKEPRI